MGDLNFTKAQSKACLARVEEALRKRPMTVYEMAAAVHICEGWAREYVRELRARGLIHIHAYRPVRTKILRNHKVYAWGPGKDAPKPAPETVYQRNKRRRADPEFRLKESAWHKARRIKPHRDWVSSWIPDKQPEAA